MEAEEAAKAVVEESGSEHDSGSDRSDGSDDEEDAFDVDDDGEAGGQRKKKKKRGQALQQREVVEDPTLAAELAKEAASGKKKAKAKSSKKKAKKTADDASQEEEIFSAAGATDITKAMKLLKEDDPDMYKVSVKHKEGGSPYYLPCFFSLTVEQRLNPGQQQLTRAKLSQALNGVPWLFADAFVVTVRAATYVTIHLVKSFNHVVTSH